MLLRVLLVLTTLIYAKSDLHQLNSVGTGTVTKFYRTGEVRTIMQFKKYRNHGTWKYYLKDGTKWRQSTFNNGVSVSIEENGIKKHFKIKGKK